MTHPLPNPDEEAERQMMIPAGDWYGRRANGPMWDKTFLDATLAAGSIVETGAERGPGASWVRVLTVIGFVCLCVVAATVGVWMPR